MSELLKQASFGGVTEQGRELEQAETDFLFRGMRKICEELLSKHGVVESRIGNSLIENVLTSVIFIDFVLSRRMNPLAIFWGRHLTKEVNSDGESSEVTLASIGGDLKALKKSPIAIKIRGLEESLVLEKEWNVICRTNPSTPLITFPKDEWDWCIIRQATLEDAQQWQGVVEALQQACATS